MKTEEEEPAVTEVPAIKEEEQEGSSVVEEVAQQVVSTEENSNVAINYSQQNNQLVYQTDGTYIEYAYQVVTGLGTAGTESTFLRTEQRMLARPPSRWSTSGRPTCPGCRTGRWST